MHGPCIHASPIVKQCFQYRSYLWQSSSRSLQTFPASLSVLAVFATVAGRQQFQLCLKYIAPLHLHKRDLKLTEVRCFARDERTNKDKGSGRSANPRVPGSLPGKRKGRMDFAGYEATELHIYILIRYKVPCILCSKAGKNTTTVINLQVCI